MKLIFCWCFPTALILTGCQSTEEHPSTIMLESYPVASCESANLDSYSAEFRTSDFLLGWQALQQGRQGYQQASDLFAQAVANNRFANISSLYYDYVVYNLMGQDADAYAHFSRGKWHYTAINYGENLGRIPDLDPEEVQWIYLRAQCEQPNESFALGSMYLYGLVFPEDRQQAVKYLTVAAEQKHIRAQYRLGLIYSENQQYHEAFKWLRIAEDNGHPDVGDYDQYVEMLL